MNKPRITHQNGRDPFGDYLNREGYWNIGAVNVTTQWDELHQRPRIMFTSQKYIDGDHTTEISHGHESTFGMLNRYTPSNQRFVIARTTEEGVPRELIIPGSRGRWADMVPVTEDEYSYHFLRKWAESK